MKELYAFEDLLAMTEEGSAKINNVRMESWERKWENYFIVARWPARGVLQELGKRKMLLPSTKDRLGNILGTGASA